MGLLVECSWRLETLAHDPVRRGRPGSSEERVSEMTIYVAEISGRGIVAFDAANDDEARARLADKALQRDHLVFQIQGRSLWNGVSEIQLRGALPEEAETWKASYPTAERSHGSGDNQFLFLLPVW